MQYKNNFFKLSKEFFLIPFSITLLITLLLIKILSIFNLIRVDGIIYFPLLFSFCAISCLISIVISFNKLVLTKKTLLRDLLAKFLLFNLSIVILLNLIKATTNAVFTIAISLNLFLFFLVYFIFDKNIFTENNSSSKKDYLLCFFLVLLGFFIRFYKVDFLTPVTDEFYHLLAAKRYFLEGSFNYIRAPFISLSLGILFKIFNSTSLIIARIPEVIIGSITIFTIYLFNLKLNKTVALISSVLLCTLPVAVGLSRYIREYVFFFFFAIVYLMWTNYILDGFVKKTFSRLKLIVNSILIFITPLFYYLFVEDSNFIIQLYFFIIIYSLISISFDKEIRERIINSKWFKVKITFIVIFTFVLLYVLFSKVSWLLKINIPDHLFTFPTLNYFDALFNPSFSPWGVKLIWFSGSSYPTFFIFFLFLFGLIHFYKNRYYISSLVCFSSVLLAFLYFANRYYAIRYIFYSLIFYIIIFSCSIYLLLKIKGIYQNRTLRIIYIILIFSFLFTIFNPTTVLKGLKEESIGSVDPKKELLGYNYPELFEKLKKEGFEDGDFVISSDGISNALAFYFNKYNFIKNPEDYPLMRFEYRISGENLSPLLDITTIYNYYYTNPYNRPCFDKVCNEPEDKRIEEIISENSQGWIIIDKDRNRNWNSSGFPLNNFVLGNKDIKFRGSTEGYRGFDIYSW